MKKQLNFYIGGPACGKGTHIGHLGNYLCNTHICSGDLLKEKADESIKNLIGTQASFAPDLLVMSLVVPILLQTPYDCDCDGFFRNTFQLGYITKFCQDNDFSMKFIYFKIDKKVAKQRSAQRYKKIQRAEDTPERFEKRWSDFERLTLPALEEAKKIFPSELILEVDVNTDLNSLSPEEIDNRFAKILNFITK